MTTLIIVLVIIFAVLPTLVSIAALGIFLYTHIKVNKEIAEMERKTNPWM